MGAETTFLRLRPLEDRTLPPIYLVLGEPLVWVFLTIVDSASFMLPGESHTYINWEWKEHKETRGRDFHAEIPMHEYYKLFNYVSYNSSVLFKLIDLAPTDQRQLYFIFIHSCFRLAEFWHFEILTREHKIKV